MCKLINSFSTGVKCSMRAHSKTIQHLKGHNRAIDTRENISRVVGRSWTTGIKSQFAISSRLFKLRF